MCINKLFVKSKFSFMDDHFITIRLLNSTLSYRLSTLIINVDFYIQEQTTNEQCDKTVQYKMLAIKFLSLNKETNRWWFVISFELKK